MAHAGFFSALSYGLASATAFFSWRAEANDDAIAVTFIWPVSVAGTSCQRLDATTIFERDDSAGYITLIQVADGITKVTQFTHDGTLQFNQSHDHSQNQNRTNKHNFS